jgi:Family of unknown function (DUF5689)
MKNTIIKSLLVLLASVTLIGSCVRKKFDTPPLDGTTDPIVAATDTLKTILALKQSYNGGTDPITENWVISGVVISSDKEGSFYKELIIQDSTAGISIKLDKQGTHYEYPIGRRIFVNLKGLTMSNYGKTIQIGYGLDLSNGLIDIPGVFINKHILKGKTGQFVIPKKMTIPQILASVNNYAIQGTLVEVDSVEFPSTLNGSTYAQAPTVNSRTDRTIQDCPSNSLIIRMSGYSQFQAKLLPTGNGTARLIAGRYNNDPFMLMSTTSDLNLTRPRCAFGNAADTLSSIATLKALYASNGNVTTPVNFTRIRAVVISNKENIGSLRNLVIQERNGMGIAIRFANTVTSIYDGFTTGDSVELSLNGVALSEYNSNLQLGELSSNNILNVAKVQPIQPKEITLATLMMDFEKYKSTLVKVKNITKVNPVEEPFNSAGNFGNIILTDDNGTSKITNYVSSFAPWKAVNCKVNIISLTGIIGQYTTTRQISPRTILDIEQ